MDIVQMNNLSGNEVLYFCRFNFLVFNLIIYIEINIHLNRSFYKSITFLKYNHEQIKCVEVENTVNNLVIRQMIFPFYNIHV